MAIKTILVLVTDDSEGEHRVKAAMALAGQLKAVIRGLYVLASSGGVASEGRIASTAYQSMHADHVRKQASISENAFRAAAREAGVDCDWTTEDSEYFEALSHHAHIADLAIVTRATPKFLEDYVSYQTNEKLILHAGCPVLVLPPEWTEAPIGERILIAWRPSSEAIRAVRNAIPFLQKAQEISLIHLVDKSDPAVDPNEIETYLARHGVSAHLEEIPGHTGKVSKILLDRARSVKADMIVMGVYGHSKLHELVFGGLSMEVMRRSPLPLFTCH